MNRNKKGLHKVTANVLSFTLASVMAAGVAGEAVSSVQVYASETSQAESVKTGTSVYLNGTVQSDSKGDGTTKEKAVSSIDTALKLAGSQGTILVCGPVTISTEKTLSVPSGVQFKRDAGYTGAIIKITGKGKLTLSGGGLQASDVDTSEAELGAEALIQDSKAVTKKAGQVTMASQVSIASPEAWSSFDFKAAGFTGEGTFSWASEAAPEEYQFTAQVIFTPKDTENYDYSKIQGWDNSRNAVVRNVEVTVDSLKPAPPVQTAEEENSQNNGTESNSSETEEEKTEAQVTMPGEIKVSSPEDIKNFDFGAAGFTGEGEFSWEKESVPDSYETEFKVVFTPSDTGKKDYSKVEGWDSEKGQVIRTVKVFTESLKEETSQTAEEKNDTSDQSDQNVEKDPQTESASEDEKENGGKEQTQTDQETDIETDKEDTEVSSEEKDPVKGEEQESQNKEEISSEESVSDEEEGFVQAQPGKTGEVAQEIPQAVPVGSLIDENTGVRVEGDFLPYYIDLQVSYNQELDQLPDAGIGEILSAYEIKLWDLKEDQEYTIPEGKKVRVMIPLPENADDFSQLSVAHYLGNSEYEYYTLPTEEYSGNLAVINIEGIDFLTFETASFSPFNVGGSQLVGPGLQISQSGGASSDKNTESSISAGNTSGGTGGDSKTNNSSSASGQSVIKPSGNSGSGTSTGSQTGNTANKNNSSRMIRVVKTGDSAPIVPYIAAGGVAMILAFIAVIKGTKKRS